MSAARIVLLVGGGVVAWRGGKYLLDRRTAADYRPIPTTGNATAEWRHIPYVQIDTLGKARGYVPAHDPLLPNYVTPPLPLMTLADAANVFGYWAKKVEKYKGDQTYQTNTLQTGLFSVLLAPAGGSGLAGLLADEEVKTTNPYRRLYNRMQPIIVAAAERRGVASWAATWSSVDRATPPNLKVLFPDEIASFWATIHSVAGDLKVTEEFNPSDWDVALAALKDAAKGAPETFAKWIGSAGATAVKGANEIAGGLSRGLIAGFVTPLLPFLILLLVAYVVIKRVAG